MTSRKGAAKLRLVSEGDEPPRPPLTDQQREALAELLAQVFVYLRSPGYAYFWNSEKDWKDVKKLQATVDRAVAIGEAFHNVPRFLLRDGFSFDLQEAVMQSYVAKCPDMQHLIDNLRDIRAMGEKSKR